MCGLRHNGLRHCTAVCGMRRLLEPLEHTLTWVSASQTSSVLDPKTGVSISYDTVGLQPIS